MAIPVGVSLLVHFAALSEPRQHAKVLYPLPEILLLVLSATIAGADDFVETTLWGTEHLTFLRRFYRYANGIPSHDTLCDVFAALDPELFKACFLAWVGGLRDDDPDIIAIDGKTSRRSHDRRKGRNPLHLVSAWAARQQQFSMLLSRVLILSGRCRHESGRSAPATACTESNLPHLVDF